MHRSLVLCFFSVVVVALGLGCSSPGEHDHAADNTHSHADGTTHADADHDYDQPADTGGTHSHADGTVHADADPEHDQPADTGGTHSHADGTVHPDAAHEHDQPADTGTHSHADGTVHADADAAHEHDQAADTGGTHSHADGSVHADTAHEHGDHAHQLSLDDTCDESREGVRLVMSYDQVSSSFIGTLENVTDQSVSDVRVEVQLSNGKKLTERATLAAGQRQTLKLSAAGQIFEWWQVHFHQQ